MYRLMKKMPIVVLACAMLPLKSMAQESDFKLNVSVSGGYNINTNVGDILVPEDYSQTMNSRTREALSLVGTCSASIINLIQY